MSRENVDTSEALTAFRAAYEQSIAAFNRHDFEGAFSATPPDIEWHPLPMIPGAHKLLGSEAIKDWFRQVAADFPDFRTEDPRIREASPGVFIVEFINRATGRSSGIEVAREVAQVWELARQPWRVREYETLDEALEAVGLRE